ncbi:MAG: peptidoglycan -binding protein [Acetobacteraceae bacterium]|nr:peptidoglycan -binding protein [Acetobacteraceae bacterium]
MALRRRSAGHGEGLNPWPGYVDALSTLLMVIIFVLLVFVLGQAFLSVALTGRDRALDRVNRQISELSDLLSLERSRSGELRLAVAQLNRDLTAATAARDTLAQRLTTLRTDQQRAQSERDQALAERDRLSARLADAEALVKAAQARSSQQLTQGSDLARQADAAAQAAATTAAQLATARQELEGARTALDANRRTLEATQQDLLTARSALAAAHRELAATQARVAEMQAQAQALDRTVRADRATIEARLSDLARMAEQMRALTALRDELEKQAREAAAQATTEAQQREAVAAQLADERKLGDSARAQIALLNRQVEELRTQLSAVGRALEVSEASARDKDVQITNLGQRLNAALAQKVEELQGYRSEFFGRLREVLANRPGIQVVGDRFVFQSEVLFPVGSAELSPTGMEQIFRLADTLRDVTKAIPPDVNWLLRVDGHADRQPVAGARFASNWELSASRAITVVKLLALAGIPANRLAATGFGDNQPLDDRDTPEAYARNRRIELRLTDR